MTGASRVRPLTPADHDEVFAVLADDGGFSQRVEGHAATPEDTLGLLHPQEVHGRTTHPLGLFTGTRCVAVADVLVGWPEPGTAHVGLLQVRAAETGRGHGRRLHEAVVDHARHAGCSTLRLTVVAPNLAHAQGFWASLGYRLTGEVRPWANAAGQQVDAHVMTRPLDPAG